MYTSPDLCFIEPSIQPVQDAIDRRRQKFLENKPRMLNNEEPFHIAFKLSREADTPG